MEVVLHTHLLSHSHWEKHKSLLLRKLWLCVILVALHFHKQTLRRPFVGSPMNPQENPVLSGFDHRDTEN